MSLFRTSLFCLIFYLYSLNKILGDNDTDIYIEEDNSHSDRQSRINPLIIPFWRIYVVPRTPCRTVTNLNGMCLSKGRCDSTNGSPSGSCAQRRGVCCIIQRTCGQSSSAPVTYFRNPEYPSANKGGTRCTLQINKANSYICQLRIDFFDLTLSQPSSDGSCSRDFFTVTDTTVPTICGSNSNQHIYVDFNNQCDFLQLVVDTDANVADDRTWNMMITQIPCNSTNKVPRGCLQFFNTTSGSVSSFNYGSIVPTTTGIENRQLNKMNYGICVKPISDYCGIEWMAANANSFSVSGDAVAGQPNVAGIGLDCDHNFIVIPNPYQNGEPLIADRFCGTAFDDTITNSQPYVLTVVTNHDESNDAGNRGFQLNFRQIACRS